MRRICDPMIGAMSRMTTDEIVLAMKGFYATSESNCPWYAFALRHVAPGILATVGQGRDDYEAKWEAQAIEARRAIDSEAGVVGDESAVA
jgi:hypothetical protein